MNFSKKMKKFVAILSAIAMVVAGITYTPQTIQAATLAAEGVTYEVGTPTGNYPGFTCQGAFEDTMRFGFAWEGSETTSRTATVVVKKADETILDLKEKNNGDSIYVSELASLDAGEYVITFTGTGDLTSQVATVPLTVTKASTGEDEDTSLKWKLQTPETDELVKSDYTQEGFEVKDIPADADKWSYGAFLEGVPVTEGQTYTVSLKLTSTVNKVIPVEVTNGSAKKNEDVNVTAEGTTFSYKFTAKADTISVYMPLGQGEGETLEEAYTIIASEFKVEESEPDPVEPTIDYAAKLTTEENLAYNKTAVGGPTWREGQAEYLTDGIADKGNKNYGAITVENGKTGYFDVDLGQTYSAESIDAVVIWWRSGDSHFYPKNGYSIQFGVNGVYDTVAKTTSDDYPEERANGYADGDQMMVPTVIDKSAMKGNVSNVRVYIDEDVEWGAQIAEIAVFSEKPGNPVEVEPAANAAAVSVSSTAKGELTFNITAGENQEGYKYFVYLDDAKDATVSDCEAGKDYTLTDLESGMHTIKVVSYYAGGFSEGIVSEAVKVKTVVDDAADYSKNFALDKAYELAGDKSAEGDGSVTNGIISGTDYATTTKNTAEGYFIIDLGKEYNTSLIKNVSVWYRILTGGCWPEKEGQQVQFSTDKNEWSTVATVSQDEFDAQRVKQNKAPFVISADITTEIEKVRYVRIFYPAAVIYGAQVTEIAVFGDVPAEDIPKTPIEVTGQKIVSQKNMTVKFSWTETDEQVALGQLYNVYIDGAFYKEGVKAQELEYTFTTEGKHTIKITAVVSGRETEGVTMEVEVKKQVESSDTTTSTTTPSATTNSSVTTPDASSADVTSPDASSADVTSPDASSADVTTPDVSTPDVSTPDVTTPDVSTPDVSTPDASTSDETTTPKVTTAKPTAKPTVKPTTAKPTTKKVSLKQTKVTKKVTKKLSSKKVKLTFKKVKGAKKYTIQVSTSKKFKKVLYKKTVKKTKVTLSSKKLKGKKKLYIRVKAVGAKKWSKPVKIKVKK